MKKILIITLILILPIVALAAALFSDGFEDGTTDAWSSVVNNGGDLSVTTAAKLHGNYGLNCLINDTTDMYVQDTTPTTETRYRVRFYIDPNGVSMAENDEFSPFWSFNDSSDTAFWVALKYTTEYVIYVGDRADGAWNVYSAEHAITDDVHCIEVDWTAATGAGQNDGTFTLWIDGVLKETVGTIDNDTENINFIRFGCIGKDAGTSGTHFLDDFASNDDGSLIGQIGDNAIFFGMNF